MNCQLIAAPHTPFHPDGSLNLPVIDRQAEHLLRSGVTDVFVCGTTGEGLSLTSAERRAVTERWVRAGGLTVITHVGHASQREAAELARHAVGAGALAVASVPPFYHKPADEAAAVEWLAVVAAAAPEVMCFFYDIPSVTGVRLRTDMLMRLAADRIPTFGGVKFSNPDMVLLQECLAAAADGCGRVLFGCDEMLLAAIALGVDGAVGSTYNFMAPLYRRMLDAVAADDGPTARRLQARSVAVVRVLERFGGLAAGKAAMGLAGVDCGPVRPPLAPLDPGAVERLRQGLEAAGFFDPGVCGAGGPAVT